MARKEYRVEGFKGIDQSKSENKLSPEYSPEAYNMDTKNGDLAVAQGFVKHFATPVPGEGRIRRMYLWHTPTDDRFLIIAGDSIYHYVAADGEIAAYWETIYTYAETITSTKWDFEEIRIGTDDYLIIANGQTQLVKWSGDGNAELFGSGEYVYEGTIASLTHNMVKAESTTYAEADGIGTYTLTMPSGWSYSAEQEIAFDVPSPVVNATSIRISAGGTDYTANYVPAWISDDVGVVKLTSESACEISLNVYGVDTVTLSAAIGEDWNQRTLDVGITLDGTSYPVSEINEARTVVTLEEPCTQELEAGDTAKVRGGVSDASVGYVEIHFSRLFAAGDADHPSRLYWSQPPGDTRNIEDWSSADASSEVSGGFVDVGNTNSDPIVGLKSLSNQLLIFKETSLYRLLGDRPSNFRITHVNLDVEKMTNTGCVSYADTPYWLTRAGMYYHNGQTAMLSRAAKQISTILADADLENCKACENRDQLYFTMKLGTETYDDSIIVYDMTERTYMLRNGFNVIDICAKNGTMFMINENRYVYRFGEGTTYDGEKINAYWRTPVTDLSNKRAKKAFRLIYFRGEGDIAWIDFYAGNAKIPIRKNMPSDAEEVLIDVLSNSSRTFHMRIYNTNGGHFKILGGIEITFDQEDD